MVTGSMIHFTLRCSERRWICTIFPWEQWFINNPTSFQGYYISGWNVSWNQRQPYALPPQTHRDTTEYTWLTYRNNHLFLLPNSDAWNTTGLIFWLMIIPLSVSNHSSDYLEVKGKEKEWSWPPKYQWISNHLWEWMSTKLNWFD